MRYLLTKILLFATISLVAQNNFKSGYIINNNKDTIYGELDYKNNNSNAKKCVFREDINSEIKIYTPENIKAYRFIDSKYYISKTVNTKEGNKLLFLEYLIDGVIDIFYYHDNNGKHYFINDSSGKLYELKTDKYTKTVNNTEYIKEKKEYVGMLKYAFNESETISNKVDHVVLNHNSLIKITRDYHNEVCLDEECIIYEKKPSLIIHNFGLLIGINGISFIEKDDNSEIYYLKDNPFGFNVYPSIGLYYKVNMPFINERLYFQYEATYSRVKLATNSTYTEPIYNITYINEIELILSSFNNTGIFKYELPSGKICPTFQIGGFLNFLNSSYSTREYEEIIPWKDESYISQSNSAIFEKYDYGINFGFGIKTLYTKNKELFLDLRYQKGFGAIKNFNTNTFIINLGFQIL